LFNIYLVHPQPIVVISHLLPHQDLAVPSIRSAAGIKQVVRGGRRKKKKEKKKTLG
jgi:hypothetical protein